MLTSRIINLGLSEVSAAERGAVFLSFFYQWKGNGEPPDALDNMRVEFLDVDSLWVTVATLSHEETFEMDVFYDTLIQVTGEQFFHDEFQ